MTTDEFFNRLDEDNRTLTGTHALEPPLTDSELAAWKASHPTFHLPDDFVGLLRRANGFKLRADRLDDCGEIRLLSLRDIQFAPRELYDGRKDEDADYPPGWLAVTLSPDGDRYIILDTATNHYIDIDPVRPLEPTLVMEGLDPFLDYLLSQFVDFPYEDEEDED